MGLVFLLKNLKNLQKGVDIVATMWYNYVTENEKKGENMAKKIKVHISICEEVYRIGKEKAESIGIPFSTYLSILISNDNQKKGKTK